MKKLFSGAFFLLAVPLLSGQTLSDAARNVRFHQFQLDVFEHRGDKVGLVDSRTVELPEGKMRGFMAGNFTLDLTAKPEEKGVAVVFQLVTLGPSVENKAGAALLDTERVLSIADLPGKGESRYQVELLYRGSVRKKVDCTFEDFQWYSDRSSRHDLWFVRRTWGDFHWNLLRDRVEQLTDSLSRIFNLATSQRPEHYFSPCLLSDWVWDGRFYFSLEPARRRALSAYGREANSFSPWVPNLLLLYLAWGYAPAPLAEGAAAFFDYPHFFAQEYLKQGKLDSIAQFITTYRYRRLPAEKGLMEAASFVRFLVERYGAGAFERLYKDATDLSVREELEKLYGASRSELEAQWRKFLFAFQPEAGPLRQVAREEFFNYRFGEALKLFQKALAFDPAPQAEDFEEIANQFYNLGRYDSARVYYRRAYEADSNFWQRPYAVANFALIRDDTAEAERFYRRLLDIDTSLADGIVRQATYSFESGDFGRAESLYLSALKKQTRPDDLAELNLNLGFITWKRKGDFKKGNEMLNAAWRYYRQLAAEAPGLPLPYLRVGELFTFKGMADSAEANLKFALYLETRPYYLGKILVRLGNLYDLSGRRREAAAAYNEALKLAAAPLERRRARAYLKRPFSMAAK